MVSAEPGYEENSRDYPALSGRGVWFRLPALRDRNKNTGPDRCEDAVPVLKELSGERVLLGIADGLGGYAQGFDDRSGGQIASETAMKAAVDWFNRSAFAEPRDAESLTNAIFKKLKHLQETRLEPSRIRGSLGRHKLATTLAMAVVDGGPDPSKRAIRCFWIGDSRIYFFDRAGLHQLSRDDNLTGSDAFDSIIDPPPMSQFLAATMEREWRIHLREFALNGPGIVLLCTDGCYSVWPSPWAFEAALQNALEHSVSWSDWIERFKSALEPLLSDDASLALFPVGLADVFEFRKLRAETETVLQRCIRAEKENRLLGPEIWSSVYRQMYEATPGPAEDPDASEISAAPSNAEASFAEGPPGPLAGPLSSERPEHLEARRFLTLRQIAAMFGLAWLAGFFCGIASAEKIVAWLKFFWHWFESLWQST